MLHRYWVVSLMLMFGTVSGVEARPFRVSQLPNGNSFGCRTCHDLDTATQTSRGQSGLARNRFGQAVENQFLSPSGARGNVQWGATLAGLDSDGDGATNGAELGDPDGDGTPTAGAEITHPGDPNSKPQPPPNKAPVFASLAEQIVKEGELLSFLVEASDEDNDPISFTASGLPEGANFEEGFFSWTPDFDLGGETQEVTFVVSDGKDEASITVKIGVEEVDRPASISAATPSRSVMLGTPVDTLQFSVTASDPDGDMVTYTWTVNGVDQEETGPSFFLPVSSGEADDVVTVSVSSGGEPVVRSWTVGKSLKADFNADGTVNFTDFVTFAGGFGRRSTDSGFDARLDLNGNDSVDFADFVLFAQYFGMSAP